MNKILELTIASNYHGLQANILSVIGGYYGVSQDFNKQDLLNYISILKYASDDIDVIIEKLNGLNND